MGWWENFVSVRYMWLLTDAPEEVGTVTLTSPTESGEIKNSEVIEDAQIKPKVMIKRWVMLYAWEKDFVSLLHWIGSVVSEDG